MAGAYVDVAHRPDRSNRPDRGNSAAEPCTKVQYAALVSEWHYLREMIPRSARVCVLRQVRGDAR